MQEKSSSEGTRRTAIVFVDVAVLPALRRLATASIRHYPASLRENFLFDTRNNAAFLFDTETEILSYLSFTRVFLSHLTFPSAWTANGVKS